jgi:VIT1/CCC1 family predicted Fe2+/Mn2+ transporter
MQRDAIGAHALDELGISPVTTAKPIQAAFASAASFTCGAILPLLIAVVSPVAIINISVITSSLVCLIMLGILGTKLSGVKILKPTLRVLLWGIFSLGFTTLIGVWFGIKP